ncbi:hypothetical protein ACLOJK_034243 [Asimina triloba]
MDRFRKGLVGLGVMLASWPFAVIPFDGGLDDLGLPDGEQDRLLVRLKRADLPSPRLGKRHRCREVPAVDLDANEAARAAGTLERGHCYHLDGSPADGGAAGYGRPWKLLRDMVEHRISVLRRPM